MSADNERFFELGDPERHAEEGFTATATGADVIYRWLELKHSVAGNEMLQAPNMAEDGLELGKLEIEDSTLRAIFSFIKYDENDLEYEIRNAYILSDEQGVSPFAQLFVDPEQQAKDRQRILFGVRRSIRDAARDSGIEINYTESKLVLKSTDPATNDEFVLHPIDKPGLGSVFCFHCKRDVDHESLQQFDQRYQAFADFSALVGNAFYNMRRLTAPSKVIELKPPKNLDTKLDNAEGMIKQRRRMLAQTGLIDGDEELAATIREKVQLIQRPTETFADIGGNAKAKEELQTIVDALQDPDAYRKWGTSAPRGVLLFGEPGTGKTMLTKALANEAGVSIYVVELADVLHSLYGRTERLVNEVFTQARQNAPVIILFDELDALAGNRNQSTEVTSRIVTVLQTNLDGLKEKPEGIVVVGTTNRVDAIDPALKRPGRLDMLVPVDMPDENERAIIFNLKMQAARNIAQEVLADPSRLFDPSFDIANLAAVTKDFSGADIQEVLRRTLARKVRQEKRGEDPIPVTTQDVLDVIAGYETVRKARRIGFSTPTPTP